MEVTVKGETTKIVIEVQERAYPDSNDYWDGNWLKTNLEIHIPGVHASFPTLLRNEDFSFFLKELKKINNQLSGSAEFKTMENAIHLRAEISRSGKMKWRGKVIHPVGVCATLTFVFENDQSYLPPLLSELEAVTKEFPVKGKPNH